MTAALHQAPISAEQKNANRRARVLIWGAALIVILNGLFPLVWIFLTSLKPEGELGRLPITYLPHTWTLQNYATVLGFDPTNPSPKPFWRWFFNSVFIAVVSSFFAVLVSSLVAYVVARMNIKGKGAILGIVAGVSMFPLITLIVPLFQTMRAAGLLNTYFALIIPYTVLSLPVCTLMMVGFFQQIPRDLENAAMVDGCTRIQSLWKVVFPLAAPGVFTAAILAFVNAWEEFLLALTLIQREDMRTLAVGITLYQGEFSFPWALISAALVMAMVPVAVVVVIFQERVVGGLTAGGVKG